MSELNDFKAWLENNTNYSKRTISNIVSRFKRANGMLCWYDDDIYLFRLEQTEQYGKLSSTVRSQVKKAVKLYFEYINSKDNCTGKDIL